MQSTPKKLMGDQVAGEVTWHDYLERKLEVLQRTVETIRKRQENLVALTPAVQAVVDQVAATRGAVDSQTALIKGIPQMIADAIAKDRAANPSLTAEGATEPQAPPVAGA